MSENNENNKIDEEVETTYFDELVRDKEERDNEIGPIKVEVDEENERLLHEEEKKNVFRVKGRIKFKYDFDIYINAINKDNVEEKINDDLNGGNQIMNNLQNERFDECDTIDIKEADGEIINGTFYDRETINEILKKYK